MIRPLPKIKICGVTREADLELLATSGVDAVGLNLVPTSPRYVSLARARELAARATALNLAVVGVVMNLSTSDLQKVMDEELFDFIQLHGAERPAALAMLKPSLATPDLIRAVSWSGRQEEQESVKRWQEYRESRSGDDGLQLRAFLVDAYAPGQGGGTGRVARWDLLSPRPSEFSDTPLILAGGLNAENVAEGIEATAPVCVDTASGVEESPGRKSAELVQAFASKAKLAFAKLAR
jgi:phosphoribosylanthranilate isomerase